VLHAVDTRLGYGFVERDARAARDATRALLRLSGCRSELDKLGHAPSEALRRVESGLTIACDSLARGAVSDLESMPRASVENPFDSGLFDVAAGQQMAERARNTIDEIER
jgi:hypothetical protein